MRFQNKTALVTGGASGIGAACAALLAREGANVVIGDLNAPPDASAFRQTDIGDPHDCAALAALAADRFGAADLLVNCAGIAGMGTVPDVDEAAWRKVMSVNLDGVYHMSRAVLPAMVTRGSGAIVNVASISGMAGDFGMAAYNTAKAGVINLTRAMAIDHAAAGVRVNAVAPGLIDTPLIDGARAIPGLYDSWIAGSPMRRAGRPEEIAEVIAFLLSDAASFVNGALLVADGGVTAHTGQPNLGDHIAQLQANYS